MANDTSVLVWRLCLKLSLMIVVAFLWVLVWRLCLSLSLMIVVAFLLMKWRGRKKDINMIKFFAVIANLCLLGTAVLFFVTEGPPREGRGFFIAILMILAPILSFIAMLRHSGENWLSLYLRRKAIEEQAKIDRLTNK